MMGFCTAVVFHAMVDCALTSIHAGLDHAALASRIPLGRLGKPEEIASAALFLAQNQYAHNCVINLDGGLSAV